MRTETVTVQWLMENLVGSVEGFALSSADGWSEMVRYKSSHNGFGALLEAIMTDGFRVPICIRWDEKKNGYELGNGHHRMSAAILLCLDQLLIVYGHSGDYMRSNATSPENHELPWKSDNDDEWHALLKEVDI